MRRSILLALMLTLLSTTGLLPSWATANNQNNRTASQVSQATSKIYVIDTLTSLKEEKNLDENTLVIFDIDKVLQIKADPWERGFDAERKKNETINSLFVEGSVLNEKLDRATRDKLWSIYAKSTKVSRVESDAPDIILALQSKAKVICLTRFFTGKLGLIPSMEEFRIHELKSLGYDFRNAFPKNNNMIFNEFSYENKHPAFREGVLFTTLAVSKGDLLKAFLNRIHWKPKKVIMVDDTRGNLESVEDYLNSAGIPFVGYEYTGYTKVPKHFDKKLAEFQMKYLIDHEKWLDSDSAKKLMKDK